MSLFKDMLRSDQTLFKNPIALDYDFLPKAIPYRENEQQIIATCIKPLFSNRNGKNVFVYGSPGIGKTAACRHVLLELEEETDDIIPLYVNCWQKNTTFKILCEISEQLGYKFTHNKKTEELFKIVENILNKRAVVFVFDEVDKLEEQNFLYSLLERIYRKTIILLTNFKSWQFELDMRIKSRLVPEMLEFKAYTSEETKGILTQRIDVAFYPDVWSKEAIERAVKQTVALKDIRSGLYILKEAGNAAEEESKKQIEIEHVTRAITKLTEFSIKKSTDLDPDLKAILDIVKNNTGKKIGDLYKIYRKKGGESVYKTFQRKVAKLEKNKFVTTKKTAGGAEGNTTLVSYSSVTTLDDF